MKSNLFIAACMTAIFIVKLLEGTFFQSLIDPVLLNWLVLLAFIASWLKVFGIAPKTKEKKPAN